MAARGSAVMQFAPNEVYQAATPPASPAAGQLWRNTNTDPNELLAWTGNSDNTARAYPVTKSGSAVSFGDLSDDRTLNVTVKTVATQAGSGDPLPTNIRAISGKASVIVSVNDAEFTFAPTAPLYGLTGAEDEIGGDGHEIHKTRFFALDGGASVSVQADLGTVLRVYTSISSAPAAATSAPALCSHLVKNDAFSTDTPHFYTGGNDMFLFIPKALLATNDAAGVKAWLGEQAAAGTPVQVVYQLATPTAACAAPVEITGAGGINTVVSDGASVTVEYTGSGWAAVGAVQRVAIEAVEITPELGIKVSQVLTDGTNTKNVYTQLYSQGLKIFDADTGEMVGGLFMRGGEVYLFSSALADPRVSADFITRIFTEAGPADTTRHGLSFKYKGVDVGRIVAGIWNYSQSAERFAFEGANDTPIEIKTSYSTNVSRELWILMDETGITFSASDPVAGTTAEIALTPDGFIYTDGHIRPGFTSGVNNLGGTSNRYRRLYCTHTVDVSSDARLKRDIADIGPELLYKLRPRAYRLKADPEKLHFGLIAQEVKAALDECGINDADLYGDENLDSLSIRYGELHALEIAAISELKRENAELKRMVESLVKRLGAEEDWAQ